MAFKKSIGLVTIGLGLVLGLMFGIGVLNVREKISAPSNKQELTLPATKRKFSKTSFSIKKKRKSLPRTGLKAWTIYYKNKSIPFKNGGKENGQWIINSDPFKMASTWGGTTKFSGTDKKNTHFIGHNAGVFSCFVPAKKGETIKVTDGNRKVFSYKIQKRVIVNSKAYEKNTGKNYYSQIVSPDGGERIVIQTCLGKTYRLILFAAPAK